MLGLRAGAGVVRRRFKRLHRLQGLRRLALDVVQQIAGSLLRLGAPAIDLGRDIAGLPHLFTRLLEGGGDIVVELHERRQLAGRVADTQTPDRLVGLVHVRQGLVGRLPHLLARHATDRRDLVLRRLQGGVQGLHRLARHVARAGDGITQRLQAVLRQSCRLAHLHLAGFQHLLERRAGRVQLGFERCESTVQQIGQLLAQALHQRFALQLRQALVDGGAHLVEHRMGRRAGFFDLLLQQRRYRLGGGGHLQQRHLHLFEQRQQGVDRHLQLRQRLVQQGVERFDQADRLVHQAGRLRAGGGDHGARAGDRRFHRRDHRLQADEQGPGQHQAGRLHHVAGADLDRAGAQGGSLVELIVGQAQGAVGLADERRDLVLDADQHGDGVGDGAAHRRKLFRQRAQGDLGVLGLVVQFAQQLQHLRHFLADHLDHATQRFGDDIDARIEAVERHARLGDHGVDAGGGLGQLAEHYVDLGARGGQRFHQDVAEPVDLGAALVEQAVARLRLVGQRGAHLADPVDLRLQGREQGLGLLVDQAGYASDRVVHLCGRVLHGGVEVDHIAVQGVAQFLHPGQRIGLQLLGLLYQRFGHRGAGAGTTLQQRQALQLRRQGQQVAPVLLDHRAAARGQVGQRRAARRQALDKLHLRREVGHQFGQLGQQRAHRLNRVASRIDHFLRAGRLFQQALRNLDRVAGQLAQVGGGRFKHADAAVEDGLRIEQRRDRFHLFGHGQHVGLQRFGAGAHFADKTVALLQHGVAGRFHGGGDAYRALRQDLEGVLDHFHL